MLIKVEIEHKGENYTLAINTGEKLAKKFIERGVDSFLDSVRCQILSTLEIEGYTNYPKLGGKNGDKIK